LFAIARELSHPDFKVSIGRIVSGDQFIDCRIKANNLNSQFDAVACEMEGAAVAHVCHVNNIPFLVVRALSDKAGSDDKSAIRSFDELKEMTAARSSIVVKELLAKYR